LRRYRGAGAMTRCKAKTNDGKRCTREQDADLCWQHEDWQDNGAKRETTGEVADYVPFRDADGILRCGRKTNQEKPADHEKVRYLVSRGVPERIARRRCFNAAKVSEGKDCCRRHGANARTTHGLTSKYSEGALAKKIDAARQDPALRDLGERLAQVAGAMDFVLEGLEQTAPCGKCGQLPARSLGAVEAISRVCDRFSRIVEREERIREGLKVKVLTEAREDIIQRVARALHSRKGDEIDKGLLEEIVREVGRV